MEVIMSKKIGNNEIVIEKSSRKYLVVEYIDDKEFSCSIPFKNYDEALKLYKETIELYESEK